ncbi:MAG TPA: DegQ family serine endoprotease [Vicinamibacteria bacterium]|nr:DegQ family serine endoprotease [Vicinamibacteria bacterium]
MTNPFGRYSERFWGALKFGALALPVALAAGLATATVHARAAAPANAPVPALAADPARVAPVASYADLVSRVAPSVVTIRSEKTVKAADLQLPDELREFFGGRLPRMTPHREGALGSGVIVSSDGYILTNNHVIDDAQRVRVELSDRRVFSARVVGTDAPSDLALVKIDAAGLPALPIGDSDKARIGDVVLAFGNPLGVGQTVTMGIISAKGRSTGLGQGGYEDFLQTDAPINQGNSGGALVNTSGELVGINSQILSPSGGNIGIGFAVPASMAKSVMAQLEHGGKVHRGQLGVTVQDVTADIARSLGLHEVKGALAGDVVPGSAAARAGLERGDVIVAYDGKPVDDANGLRNHVAETAPGTHVTLTVVRQGEQKTLSTDLGELQPTRTASNGGDDDAPHGRLGLAVEPLTPDAAEQVGAKATKGLLVDQVDPAGPAASAGFQPGDVIEQVNGKAVSTVTDLRSATANASDAHPALVLVDRKGASLFLALAPGRA